MNKVTKLQQKCPEANVSTKHTVSVSFQQNKKHMREYGYLCGEFSERSASFEPKISWRIINEV